MLAHPRAPASATLAHAEARAVQPEHRPGLLLLQGRGRRNAPAAQHPRAVRLVARRLPVQNQGSSSHLRPPHPALDVVGWTPGECALRSRRSIPRSLHGDARAALRARGEAASGGTLADGPHRSFAPLVEVHGRTHRRPHADVRQRNLYALRDRQQCEEQSRSPVRVIRLSVDLRQEPQGPGLPALLSVKGTLATHSGIDAGEEL